MQLLLSLIGLAASLWLSFISSGMETALYRVSRVRMRIRADQNDKRARLVLRVLERIDSMVTTILINNNIAAYAGTYFLTIQMAAWQVPHAELVTTAVITPLFFVFTESLPKQLAYNKADRFSMELVRAFAFLRVALAPIVWILNKASLALQHVLGTQGETSLSQSQRSLLMEHLNAGVAENVLSEDQNGMAMRIMQLEGISAGDTMIPLRRMLLLPATATRDRAVREMTRRRVPLALLIDKSGRPTGDAVTMAEMVLKPGGGNDAVASLASRLERIQAGVAIPDVLNVFRTRHARMALVYRGNRVDGLITTQTVLDRIAGIG